jgi:hypothetical protein
MAFSNKQSNLVEKGDLSPLTTKLQQMATITILQSTKI